MREIFLTKRRGSLYWPAIVSTNRSINLHALPSHYIIKNHKYHKRNIGNENTTNAINIDTHSFILFIICEKEQFAHDQSCRTIYLITHLLGNPKQDSSSLPNLIFSLYEKTMNMKNEV